MADFLLVPFITDQVADKDDPMLARGADRTAHFITFAPSRTPFAPQPLALYEDIRAAQAKALMTGTDNRKRLYT